jgi:glycosyltransferase involved in cell wall biosynthesis
MNGHRLSISVIVCAHNPNLIYLKRVFAALEAQAFPKEKWEIILVDNASAQSLSQSCDLSWHPNNLHVSENQFGLSAARRKGIKSSSGEVLVFVDDDNLLAPNYLEVAFRIWSEWPMLGVWGSGVIEPEFEREPATHLKPYLTYLALREHAQAFWGNVPSVAEAIPFGAGLCIRRRVADAYIESCASSKIQITGRMGKALSSDEDVEISYVACKIGLGMATFPELRLVHIINSNRTTDLHILKQIEATTLSRLLLKYKWVNAVPEITAREIYRFFKYGVLVRHFDRQVYFCQLRSAIRARRMIKELR